MLEIKNTGYKPVATVIGSRDQMCINSTVKQLPSGAKSAACRSLVKSSGCSAYPGAESIFYSATHFRFQKFV
jgi:hypothetical protein